MKRFFYMLLFGSGMEDNVFFIEDAWVVTVIELKSMSPAINVGTSIIICISL